MSKYEAYIQRARHRWGDKFTDSDLDPRFVRYYNTGERIKVRMWGEEITGAMTTCGHRFADATVGCTRPAGHAGCHNGDGHHIHARDYLANLK